MKEVLLSICVACATSLYIWHDYKTTPRFNIVCVSTNDREAAYKIEEKSGVTTLLYGAYEIEIEGKTSLKEWRRIMGFSSNK